MSSTTNVYGAYKPNPIVAIVGAVVFLILTTAHIWRIIKSRRWFASAIVIGGIFEIVGLAARAYSHRDLSAKNPYIIQILLILLAPILFAASVYMFLGRLIRASGYSELSFIRVTWLSKIFVIGDVFCFLVQAAGAGKLVDADTADDISGAENIILAGLALQVLFFCLFIVCTLVFHIRVCSKKFLNSIDPSLRLVPMIFSLYGCSLLITVRNIYRLAEYKEGTGGYLQIHEWPTYGLDVALMGVIMATTLLWYFSNVNGPPKGEKVHLRLYNGNM